MRERTRHWTLATLLLLSMIAVVSGCRASPLAPTATPTEEVGPTTTTHPTVTPVPPTVVTSPTSGPPDTPTIAIAPRSGPPGTSVTVQADGFAPAADLAIGLTTTKQPGTT